MERGVETYIFVGLLFLSVAIAMYSLNLGLTGFAVFQEGFNGNFTNTVYNGSSVVLAENQTSGEYASAVFDATADANWNNLVWQGTSGLSFQVKVCSTSNCSDSSFATVNLSNLSLTSRYFQYKVALSSSGNETVSFDGATLNYNLVPVITSASITEPAGVKDSTSGIPLTYSVTGQGTSCRYSVVRTSNEQGVLSNVDLPSCANTTFNLDSGEGDYALYLYVVSPSGNVTVNSSFTVDVPSASSSSSSSSSSTESTEEPVAEVIVEEAPIVEQIVEVPKLVELSAGSIEPFSLIQGESKELSLGLDNTGDFALGSCRLIPSEPFASWISLNEPDGISLEIDEKRSLGFKLSVPLDAEPKSNTISLLVKCSETSLTKEFSVEVTPKKIGFEILSTERTRRDRVRVIYSLSELSGLAQDVEVDLTLLDATGTELGRVLQNKSLEANETGEFSAAVRINESLNLSEDLKVLSIYKSPEFFGRTLESIVLSSTPVGGFAVFGGLDNVLGDSGSKWIWAVLVIVIVIIVWMFLRKRSRKMNFDGKNSGSNPSKVSVRDSLGFKKEKIEKPKVEDFLGKKKR